MGFILSKFRKTKPSIKDTLEKVDQDLRKLSRFQYDTELQQKRIIGRLVIGGVFLYLVFLVLAYFFGPRDLSWQQTLGWIVPFILFPILLITIKRVLSWYFNRKIVKNKEKYELLKKEKQRILDEVMDKETFKVAKEILEKYAPNQLLPKYLAEQQRASPASLTPVPRTAPGLRRRTNAPSSSTPLGGPGGFTPRAIRPYGPSGPGQFLRQPTNNFMRPAIMPGPGPGPSPHMPAITSGQPGPMMRGPPPPRFMLPPPPSNPEYRTRKTGWLDKLVDYVVGDGPANRFALICRYCATHNGLATPEDFPYIGYRCVYCRQFNPPRQVRPSAATLPKNTVLFEELDSTVKSPENSVNEGNDESKCESSEPKETDGNVDDAKAKDGDEEKAAEPVIELPGSSTEDLTRSLENLGVDGEEQSGVDDSQNEDEDSQLENPNTTVSAEDDTVLEKDEISSSFEKLSNNSESESQTQHVPDSEREDKQ